MRIIQYIWRIIYADKTPACVHVCMCVCVCSYFWVVWSFLILVCFYMWPTYILDRRWMLLLWSSDRLAAQLCWWWKTCFELYEASVQQQSIERETYTKYIHSNKHLYKHHHKHTHTHTSNSREYDFASATPSSNTYTMGIAASLLVHSRLSTLRAKAIFLGFSPSRLAWPYTSTSI